MGDQGDIDLAGGGYRSRREGGGISQGGYRSRRGGGQSSGEGDGVFREVIEQGRGGVARR